MALNPAALGTAVAAWMVSQEESLEEGALALANVFQDYYQTITGPIVPSHSAARDAFRDEFIEQMQQNRDPYDPTWPFLIASVEAYVDQMVSDATNTPDEVIGPPGPLVFNISATTEDPSTPAVHIASVVDVWSKTGSVVPPSGTPVLWL